MQPNPLTLKAIQIRNYRSLKAFPTDNPSDYKEIGNFVTIIGKNDAGKSAILNAIKLFLEDDKATPEDFHKFDYSQPIIISACFKTTAAFKETFSKELEELRQEQALQDDSEVYITRETYYNEEIKKIANKWFISGEPNSQIRKEIGPRKLKEHFPKVLFIEAIRDVKEEAAIKKESLMEKLLLPLIEEDSQVKQLSNQLAQAAKNTCREITQKLQEELRQLSEEVQEVIIDFQEPDLKKALSLQVKIKDAYVKEVPLTHRGAGLQSMTILALMQTYAKQNIGKGYILLFEEPELYLHPYAQRKMFTALKAISQNGQVVISTHSTIFIDRSDIESIWLVKREHGETKLVDLEPGNLKPLIEELGIKPSDILLAEQILLVEGPSDADIFRIFAEACLSEEDYSNTTIIHLGGRSNIKKEKPTALTKISHKILLVIDSDRKSPTEPPSEEAQDIKRKFEEIGIRVHILQRRTIENYFAKEAIEAVLKVKLDREIGEYENFERTINETLRRQGRTKRYSKVRDGPKIAGEMVRREIIPDEIRAIFQQELLA